MERFKTLEKINEIKSYIFEKNKIDKNLARLMRKIKDK